MKKKGLIYGGLVLALVGAALLSLLTGSARLTPEMFWNGLCGAAGYEKERVILLSIRLPRLCCALIAGVGLSLSGVLLQNVMGNPLAGPNVVGINAGASFFVVLTLSFLPQCWQMLPFSAFAGALCTVALILGISSWTGKGKSTVILAGIAVTALFQAGVSFLSALDSDVLSQYNAFSVGGFHGVEGKQLIIPALLVTLSMLLSLMLAGKIQALSLGTEIASGLGIRVYFVRTLCVVLASLSAAAVVSFAGLLGFVGLIVPHMARKMTGQQMRDQLITSALTGAVLVTISDWAGRTLFAPAEVSVGIVMALVGAPFFFALLMRNRRDGFAEV